MYELMPKTNDSRIRYLENMENTDNSGLQTITTGTGPIFPKEN